MENDNPPISAVTSPSPVELNEPVAPVVHEPAAAPPVAVSNQQNEGAPGLEASPANALCLALTIVNIVLIVFLVPSLEKNPQLALALKVGKFLFPLGVFAAGALWFRQVIAKDWFRILNGVVFCILAPLCLSALRIVTVHPQIDLSTRKVLTVDQQPADYDLDGGAVALSIRNHTIQVALPDINGKPATNGMPWEYKITWRQAFSALFTDSKPSWTPLSLVIIGTKDPNVEVLIEKTDPDNFDKAFLMDPPPTLWKQPFKAVGTEGRTFSYTGKSNSTGAQDKIYLPFGTYKFSVAQNGSCIAAAQACIIDRLKPDGYSVEFESLCRRPR